MILTINKLISIQATHGLFVPFAKWYIAKAKKVADLAKALDIINRVANCAFETGIMPEQIHPFTEESLSVAPLTWSHAEFVDTVTKYIEKTDLMEISI